MSFDEKKLLSTSQKRVLFELNVSIPNSYWVNYRPFIWYYDYSHTFPLVPNELKIDFPEINFGNVQSVRIDGNTINETIDYATLEVTENRYWNDQSNKILYLHLPNNDEPFIFDIQIGSLFGYSNYDTFVNDIHYPGRLISMPNLLKKKDLLTFGRISFQGGTISIDNSDGSLDDFFEYNNVFGWDISILLGFDDDPYSEYRKIYSGRVNTVSIDSNTAKIKIIDTRKQLSNIINTNSFTTADYADINTKNLGKRIPWIFGTCFNVPCVDIDQETTPIPGTYTFKIADATSDRPLSDITAVYVNGVTVSISTDDLNAGTMELSNTVYTAGQSVTADVVGFESSGIVIENGLDVLKYIFEEKTDFSFTTQYFNTADWTSASSEATDIGYYIINNTSVEKTIQEISSSLLGDFIVQDDGRFTFKFINESDTGIEDIEKEELLQIPNYSFDSNEITSIITVQYQKDWKNNSYRQHINTSNSAFVQNNYDFEKEREFQTLITNETDAISYSTQMIDRAGDIKKVVNITTKTKYIELDIGDIINVEVSRPVTDMIGTKKCEIIGIQKDLNSFEVSMNLRIIE